MMRKAIVCSLLAVAACGEDGGNNPNPDGNNGGDGSMGMADAWVPPADYTRLISRTWSLPGGALDTYRCVRLTMTEDTYITNIIAEAPFGTHHTVLSITSPSQGGGPDGEYNCSVGELGMNMLYASGVGTSPLDFPSGVGVKVSAGQQIHLNLHLFNATDDPISAESGIWVKSQSTPPPMLAEMVFAGKIVFALEPLNIDVNVQGGCTSNGNYTLFALWPHMHQIANHAKFELTHNGTRTALLDMPYTFSEQNYYLQTPTVQVATGDRIDVTCTFKNNTGQRVTFGDSSNQEMCFIGMYRYPAPANGSSITECTDLPGGIPNF